MRKLAILLISLLILALVVSAIGCGGDIKDTDGDGWPDAQEQSIGTDPYDIDTDGDGYWDPQDPNPLDANVPIAVATPEPSPTSTSTPMPTPTSSPRRDLVLSDAPELLNLSSLLPSVFEHIDAASEGLSNEDLGLGPECSEVEVFLREEPYQLIYTFLGIEKSRIGKASSDALFRDDEQVKAMIEYNVQLGAEEAGMYDHRIENIETFHPDIGDLAILGSAVATSFGFYYGFDCLFFRRGDVYIFMYSVYLSEENKLSLEAVGKDLDEQLLSW